VSSPLRTGEDRSQPAECWEEHWSAYDQATRQNPAHRYRRRLILGAIAPTEGGLRVLDLGCGQGDLLVDLVQRFPTIELAGLDGSRTGLASARSRAPGARLFQVDFEASHPLPEVLCGFATHVVCSEVLEHLDHPRSLLQKIRPLLAPGGRLIVTVPGGPRTAFDLHLGHRRHYSVRALVSLLDEAGYEPLLARGAGFPFFNLYKLLVLLRGRRLARDVDQSHGVSGAALRAMAIFDRLLGLIDLGPGLGWQTFGVFRPRSAGDPTGRTAP
jgi:SAM-dependent methyltransferase